MLPALRELWAGQAVTLDGLPALTISPTPRERVPVLVGGDSEAALKQGGTGG